MSESEREREREEYERDETAECNEKVYKNDYSLFTSFYAIYLMKSKF